MRHEQLDHEGLHAEAVILLPLLLDPPLHEANHLPEVAFVFLLPATNELQVQGLSLIHILSGIESI